MIRRLLSPFTLILACMVVASCATLKDQADEDEQPQAAAQPAGWQLEKQQRQEINHWEVRGRLGLQTDKTGGVLDIIWKQSGDEFSIRLIAPLGAGSHLIQGNQDFAEIRFPDGEKKIINDIDSVFASSLEVDLPASAVKDWLRGLPASALPIEHLDWNQQGLINRIKQSGWNVEMTKYADTKAGTKLLMPHAVYVSRDDDSEIDIRLILRQWLIDN